MSIEITFEGSEEKIIKALEAKNLVLIEKVVDKMTLLLEQLQLKIRGRIHSDTGKLADSVKDPKVSVEGSVVRGTLEIGEGAVSEQGFPYAQAVESGFKRPAIKPLTKEGIRMYLNPKGQWRRGHKKGAIKRTGANALKITPKTGDIIFRAAAKPAVFEGEFFVRDSVAEMMDVVDEEMMKTIREAITGWV